MQLFQRALVAASLAVFITAVAAEADRADDIMITLYEESLEEALELEPGTWRDIARASSRVRRILLKNRGKLQTIHHPEYQDQASLLSPSYLPIHIAPPNPNACRRALLHTPATSVPKHYPHHLRGSPWQH